MFTNRAERLELTQAQFDAMVVHVQAGLPHEACGLLGGLRETVHGVYPVANADQSPVSYAMDPAEQVRTMVAIEQAGWELVGIFHSHPNGPPVPSATDLAKAYYPEAVYVILAPDVRGDWRARGFFLQDGAATEVPLVFA